MKLAIVATHPIQYYAPWFRLLAQEPGLEVRVFYLWDFGVRAQLDPGFQRTIVWDIPLLEGYAHEFVPNTSPQPGTSRFSGLQNPELPDRLKAWAPDATLLMGYSWESYLRLIFTPNRKSGPLLLRGDSHRLVPPHGIWATAKNLLTRLAFARISAFLYCGKANLDYFLHRSVKNSKLFFCPHGVDQNRFRPDETLRSQAVEWKKSLGIPLDHRVVMFAGKFESKKRPLDLLEAFRSANPEKTSLLFAGSGHLEPALKQAAAGDTRILILPPENQSRMPLLYHAADLFVLPSAGPGETWGLAIQESLACGIPVIASSHVGCAEDLVHPGKNGLIFPAYSIPALKESLCQALQPGVLGRWKEGCLPALEHFNYHEAVKGLRLALGKVIKS